MGYVDVCDVSSGIWAVNAFGYQVFWNEVVLNIWQLFSTGDIINTMRIYGACMPQQL